MRIYNLFLTLMCMGLANPRIEAAPAATPAHQVSDKWSVHRDSGGKRVDHAPWRAFLAGYLDTISADGIHRVRYGRVSNADKASLEAYIAALQAVAVSALNRKEQLAYWINLYNSTTVAVVLRAYPVASILDIKYPANPPRQGPWDAEILKVEGSGISLNDIEHRILRPLWKDNRIHFALNCASLGCPNLQPEPYSPDNAERLLVQGAATFVQSPSGSSFTGDTLVLSSIFDWYKEDFGGDRKSILAFLSRHAGPELRNKLRAFSGRIEYRYDWKLNDAAPDP